MSVIRVPGLISVIVTNYNNAAYITDCLSSILHQTYQYIELIIVDDCSTDYSTSIIDQWIAENIPSSHLKDKVFFLKLPRNIGFAGAVTTALYLTHGEYIAMHDGDDCSDKTRLAKQFAYLSTHTSIHSVGSDYLVMEGSTLVHYLNGIAFGTDTIRSIYGAGGNAVSYGTLMIRGEIFDKIGGLTRNLRGAEDYEFITRLLPYGVDNIQESLYHYRSHTAQRSRLFYGKDSFPLVSSNFSILFVLDSLSIGGTETHVLTLIESLLLQGINIVIIANNGPLSPSFDALDIKIYNISFPLIIPSDNELFFYSALFKYIIHSEHINIIHCHQSPSGSIGLLIGHELQIPTVFTVHGLYYQDIVSTYLPLSSLVISVSKPVQHFLDTHNISSSLIPNGIDFKYFSPRCTAPIFTTYGIPDDAFVICYCSRLAWEKFEVAKKVCHVCSHLRELYHLNIYVFFIGEGSGFTELNTLCSFLNKRAAVDFLIPVGPQIDVRPFFHTSSCVIGSGRVALEGIACHKPVIAIGNAGYLGLITDSNFDTAWSMYFGDHASFESDISSQLQQDLLSLYHSAPPFFIDTVYDAAKALFDIENVTTSLVNLYLTLFAHS